MKERQKECDIRRQSAGKDGAALAKSLHGIAWRMAKKMAEGENLAAGSTADEN